jgi:branched-chain amino acid transport system substrate-binding protein
MTSNGKCDVRLATASAFVATFMVSIAALADDKIVKIGNLDDQSSLYADVGGPGNTVAAELAIEDSGLTKKGWSIDVVAADHQNKPDIGASIARKWLDEDKIDVIAGTGNSSVALAVAQITKDKNAVFMPAAATSALTGKACSPSTVHWAIDTYALAYGEGKSIVARGGDTWFFITADYAFGHQLEKDTTAVIQANGGKVMGSVNVPINTADFSSFLLQAQASRAKIVGLANAGGDTTNAIKQAHEFGLTQSGQTLAALLVFITSVNAVGLENAQGLNLVSTFYWDLNDGTRAFSERFAARMKNHQMPTVVQASVYSSLIHYLKALEVLGGNPHDGAKVVAKMKELPTNDPLFGEGSIRIDGRAIHPVYLFEVKTPGESKYPWDYYKKIMTIPADTAFRPLAQSECPLVKKE